jgi:PAS domain S-box-containing protein
MDALRQELDATRTRAAALRSAAERVPVLQLQLEESQKENRRQFEHAPYGLCECTREGTITRVNHSVARLLGYRRADDLRGVDFAATVFECAGDLRWLIERSVSTGTTESVETTWKTRDRRRLFVRLHVLSTDGSVAIAVEDLTNLRAVEERLRQAQRMEAVGRVASEVAVTCDTLLRDVTQGGRQWLAAIESDTPLRHQGELLLGEVTRAAGFLRQFAVYGSKQISALEPVSVQGVLRDLEPVLKRVAGDDITLVLPKTSDPFDVDVEAERVERIFVNVANYARERMPHGGRVKIDLATTVVDRRFLANHPNVRAGAHVLITVTEVGGAIRPALPIELRAAPAAAGASRSASDKPGVDLGALLALIGDLGGHLWMAAEPSGNMTLKIHLPKRASDEVTDPAAPAARSDRGRPLARWFRH